jgi:multicomponent K+:H+ antiporter subunit F
MSAVVEWFSKFALFPSVGPYTRIALIIAFVVFAVALVLTLIRLLRGPNVEDRILALDTLYVNALAITILLGLAFATSVFFEAALIIGMLGFVGTVVMAKYLARGDIVE